MQIPKTDALGFVD
jgi:hypothetical protein